jgi:acyl-coenzyme A synthetase/AMP-(fatty) acid ligase
LCGRCHEKEVKEFGESHHAKAGRILGSLDNVLAEHPDILEAATVGVPDTIYGEEVVSFVVCRAGATPGAESIIAHCRNIS